jgi:hypothetical protein
MKVKNAGEGVAKKIVHHPYRMLGTIVGLARWEKNARQPAGVVRP